MQAYPRMSRCLTRLQWKNRREERLLIIMKFDLAILQKVL
jgi:hypothetical protein